MNSHENGTEIWGEIITTIEHESLTESAEIREQGLRYAVYFRLRDDCTQEERNLFMSYAIEQVRDNNGDVDIVNWKSLG